MNSQVSIVKCKSYAPALVQEATKKAVDLLGGIANFIRPQSKVLVKPNILMGIAPEAGVDTHPEVVRSVIKILKEINCDVFVGDSPCVWGNQIENLEEVYTRSGIKIVCEEEKVSLVKFDKRRWRQKFPLTTWLDHCDYLVNIPKFKTHELTLLTGAIKNLFGLIPGTYKTELHKNNLKVDGFSKIIVDIYQEVPVALTIIDGIIAMEGDGPGTSGKLRNLGLLLAGSDGVALDTLMALIMGIEPKSVLTTQEAAKRGLGTADINAIEVLGENLEKVIAEPFLLPQASIRGLIQRRLPQPVIKIAKRLIKYYPCVEYDHCISCAACIQACPYKAISLKNKRVTFDYAKCVACFCCQEACPASAIKVKKSILAKMIGL